MARPCTLYKSQLCTSSVFLLLLAVLAAPICFARTLCEITVVSRGDWCQFAYKVCKPESGTDTNAMMITKRTCRIALGGSAPNLLKDDSNGWPQCQVTLPPDAEIVQLPCSVTGITSKNINSYQVRYYKSQEDGQETNIRLHFPRNNTDFRQEKSSAYTVDSCSNTPTKAPLPEPGSFPIWPHMNFGAGTGVEGDDALTWSLWLTGVQKLAQRRMVEGNYVCEVKPKQETSASPQTTKRRFRLEFKEEGNDRLENIDKIPCQAVPVPLPQSVNTGGAQRFSGKSPSLPVKVKLGEPLCLVVNDSQGMVSWSIENEESNQIETLHWMQTNDVNRTHWTSTIPGMFVRGEQRRKLYILEVTRDTLDIDSIFILRETPARAVNSDTLNEKTTSIFFEEDKADNNGGLFRSTSAMIGVSVGGALLAIVAVAGFIKYRRSVPCTCRHNDEEDHLLDDYDQTSFGSVSDQASDSLTNSVETTPS